MSAKGDGAFNQVAFDQVAFGPNSSNAPGTSARISRQCIGGASVQVTSQGNGRYRPMPMPAPAASIGFPRAAITPISPHH